MLTRDYFFLARVAIETIETSLGEAVVVNSVGIRTCGPISLLLGLLSYPHILASKNARFHQVSQFDVFGALSWVEIIRVSFVVVVHDLGQ